MLLYLLLITIGSQELAFGIAFSAHEIDDNAILYQCSQDARASAINILPLSKLAITY